MYRVHLSLLAPLQLHVVAIAIAFVIIFLQPEDDFLDAEVIQVMLFFFFFQAEDGIRDADVTGVQTCALPIYRRELVAADPGEGRAGIDDDQAKTFAAQARRRSERHGAGGSRADDDEPLEIDAGTNGGERVERGRGVDPRDHAARALRGGDDPERERELSHARRTDECQRLARGKAAAGPEIERSPGRKRELVAMTLAGAAAGERMRAVPPFDARDGPGQPGRSHSAPLCFAPSCGPGGWPHPDR